MNQSLCTHYCLLWSKAKCLYLVFVYITKVALLECLIFEILIGEKSCTFISLYRSPSQSSDSLVEFSDSLQLSLDKINNQNPFLRLSWVILILNLQIGVNTIKQHAKALKSMP